MILGLFAILNHTFPTDKAFIRMCLLNMEMAKEKDISVKWPLMENKFQSESGIFKQEAKQWPDDSIKIDYFIEDMDERMQRPRVNRLKNYDLMICDVSLKTLKYIARVQK